MAKNTDTTTDAPRIEIRSHQDAPKALPYSEYVTALIDAEANGVESPETTIRVPNGDTNDKGEYKELAKHKRYVQDAAKAAGYSAKVWGVEDFGDGTSQITFGLRPLITRPRKGQEGESAPESAPETVAEAA